MVAFNLNEPNTYRVIENEIVLEYFRTIYAAINYVKKYQFFDKMKIQMLIRGNYLDYR